MKLPPFLSSSVLSVVAMSLVSTLGLTACVFDSMSHRSSHRSDPPDETAPEEASPTSPMLVVVDTGEVMTAAPGDGIGIYVEYRAGGKWRVAWTCDTARSGHSCDVFLSATTSVGAISNLDEKELQGGVTSMPVESQVTAQITTSNQVHGISFTTVPGAVITLEAEVDGFRVEPTSNQSFFFFVQNGEINGGYRGALTNPLQLQGDKP